METKRAYIKPLIFFLLLLCALVLFKVFNVEEMVRSGETISQFRTLVQDNRLIAVLIYEVTAIFCLAFLAFPAMIFAFLAGVVFGAVSGTMLCVIACTIGAAIAFLIGRYFLKDSLRERVMKNRYMALLFFGRKRNMMISLAITRLVPIFPYNLQNYAYGITDIGFWPFTLGSFVFMIPVMAIYTIAAAGLTSGNDITPYIIAAVAFALVTVVAGFLIARTNHVEIGMDELTEDFD